jgi:hypothetical protein
MKKLFLLTALTGTFILHSCKKDNNNPDNQNSASLPKTYTEDVRSSVLGNSVTTYTLTYDANNRLISMVSTPSPPSLKFVYQYSPDSSYTLDLYNYNTLDIHEIFWLNSSSLMDSTFQYNNTNDTSTEKYIYDAGKELTQLKDYDYSASGSVLYSITNYTYDNSGNVITQTDNLGNSTTYDYYPDLLNTLSLGQVYLPHSHNFVKSATLTSGGNSEIATHFYTFDNNNRLIKDSIYTSGVDVIGIKSYTY